MQKTPGEEMAAPTVGIASLIQWASKNDWNNQINRDKECVTRE
jgi:hypothetical protein